MQRHGHAAPAIGMAGPDDGDRKALPAVGGHQHIFAGGLLAAVFPVRIAQRRSLGDPRRGQRLLIRRRRADKKVLSRSAGKQTDVARHVLGRVGDEVRHHVERLPLQRVPHRRLVTDIRMDGARALGHARVRVAAVEQRQVPSATDAQRRNGRADGARAADKQCLHKKKPPSRLLRPTWYHTALGFARRRLHFHAVQAIILTYVFLKGKGGAR